ncbi:BAG family molecular chaperone regulator 4 isoform X1 [Beta vulgaris subsp. vulgaris]|uniref:BAG family molecular chaperone regulator 4 isoform X1 n=1 Tax=Beta vulgaris subsp. vulgaris TaxID=3555 RepID=UPI00203721F7|nr:BAG family molecular chaperone regulator 4 isoform X1 [Beta vulgaris subsp. vulgaris]
MNPVDEVMNKEEWEMRPGGMLVQKRENGYDDDDNTPMFKIKVSYGSSFYDFTLPCKFTFGELKKLLAQATGLEPQDQKLFFRGREKDDAETLLMAGLKDHSKLLLMERPASKERKMEEARKKAEISKACAAIAEVRAEVDKLSQRVSALQESVYVGAKLDEKEFILLTELLMVQLLKLDSIEAEGEARIQRKTEVRRVQGYVDTLDALKARNSNPLDNCSNAVSVSTNWETFDSGVGSLTPPSISSSTEVIQDWERFE